MNWTTRAVALSAIALSVVIAQATSASASTPSVSATPAANMPYVTSSNATVRQIVQCGNTMYAVGDFSSVGAVGQSTVTRHDAFSFNATTGIISSWNPNPNGEVNSIAMSADCATAYLGGSFTTVQGHTASRLAKVDAVSGAPDAAFVPAPSGTVYTVLIVGARLIVGGSYSTIANTSRPALATVNLTTGAIDAYVNMNVSGTPANSSRKVYNFALSHSGTKLLAIGSYLTVAGVTRHQIFMIDLGTTATLDPWYSPDFTSNCSATHPFWLEAATWSPDDQSIYIATTGGHGAGALCDTVAKFSAAANSSLHATWINKTGCDSLYAVAADDSNVYVGGHQRWLNNPHGCDNAGSGAVARSGIGSVSPTTGLALPWNPTRSRGHGADDLLLTPAGLWVASDTFFGSVNCAGKYHPGICFFPAS